jgi:hypothetical protein
MINIEKAMEWFHIAVAAGPIKADVEYAFSELLPQLFELIQTKESEIEQLSKKQQDSHTEKLKKCERCRNSQVDFQDLPKRKCKFAMPQFPIEDEGACMHYDSRFIEYPLTIDGINNHFNKEGLVSLYKCGKLVRVSPCGEEYKGNTFLGILLGDLPIGAYIGFNRESKKLEVSPATNPGIFVPEIDKIIYGCESWWGEIETPEDLKAITNEDIENTWYVQLLKGMMKKEAGRDD